KHPYLTCGEKCGLEVSLGHLLENRNVNRLIRNHLPPPEILFLQRSQLLDHVWTHPAVFIPPSVNISLMRKTAVN
ncbi:MAG TPA: hypothetical protein VIJ25_07745, partial [Methylococcales bacterium]